MSLDTADSVVNPEKSSAIWQNDNCIFYAESINATVEVFDLMGQSLLIQKSAQFPICLDNFEFGNYIVVIKDENAFLQTIKMIHLK